MNWEWIIVIGLCVVAISFIYTLIPNKKRDAEIEEEKRRQKQQELEEKNRQRQAAQEKVDPLEICELCGKRIFYSCDERIEGYTGIDGRWRRLCQGCKEFHYCLDPTPPPKEIAPYVPEWRENSERVRSYLRSKYNITDFSDILDCKIKTLGDFQSSVYFDSKDFGYWVEYKKIEKKCFEGEITAEEAQKETDELTKRLVKMFEEKRAKEEEERRNREKSTMERFWEGHQTFY